MGVKVMQIDWNILQVVAIINLALASFWKLREITLAQINAMTDKKIADLEIRADQKFALKDELHEVREELRNRFIN